MLLRIFKLIISLCFALLVGLPRALWGILTRNPLTSCVVLCYHGVSSRGAPRFARQVSWMVKLTTPIAVGEMNRLKKGIHHVLVTFDDGLVSSSENALPVLARRRVPCVFFVPVGCLGCVPQWITEYGFSTAGETVVTAEQLRHLSPEWVEIGSHSVSHRRFCDLDQNETRWEMEESKRQLEAITGRRLVCFSFPYGYDTVTLVRQAIEAGYRHAFTSTLRWPQTVGQPTVTGRLRVSPDDWTLEFVLKILGFYCWVPAASGLKRKVQGWTARNHVEAGQANLAND